MKQKSWQIPVLFFVLLYHVLRAAVAWAPEQPDAGPAPSPVASATPTAQYTPASRPVAWVVLPTNTPAPATVVIEDMAVSATGEQTDYPRPEVTAALEPSPSRQTPATRPMTTELPLPTFSPEPTSTPQASAVSHIVQSGDTLSGIAKQYGVSVQAIVVANGITNPDVLRIDQVLVIPLAARPSPTATQTP